MPADSVVSLNTHDMPLFSSFWSGKDIEDRLGLGLLNPADVQAERDRLPGAKKALIDVLRKQGWLQGSDESALTVLKACIAFMAAGPAQAVLINLEDLWLETEPQNVPSTRTEYPNWRRKMRFTFEEFCQMPRVIDILRAISNLRERGTIGSKE